MISVSGKHWEELNIEKRLIDKISIDHNLTNIQAKLIISRNFSLEEIYSIKNSLDFKNPFLNNKDFVSACNLLKKNIDDNNEILLIGDYDVDGCVSTSLMFNFLKAEKVKVNYFIPDRFKDGYGASKDLLVKLLDKYKPQLIIFLDCGSNSHEAIKYIKNLKKNSIIIDHHNIQQPYPQTEVFINPQKKTGYYNINYLCTAFLTYFFLEIYKKRYKSKISIKKNLIYVLLATVADVMPIRKINRLLAIKTIKNFKINEDIIFTNISKILKFKKKLEIEELGYLIAPIFNSAGRLDNANQIIELLSSNDEKIIINILERIINLNNKRKLIENRTLEKLDLKKIYNQDGVIYVYDTNIQEGIIGILASKIKEYFSKPCIVFTNSGNIIKGSARSTSNFNIGEYIDKAVQKKILIKGGGHNLAAGVSLDKSRMKDFQNYLDKIYKKKKLSIINYYTSQISLSSINKNFINQVNQLSPFGNENINPIFMIKNIRITKPQIINNRFISFYIKSSNKTIRAISFHNINSKISYNILNSKNIIDVLVKVKENNWNNKKNIQLEIIDIIQTTINT
tara:strand:+ start:1450 stop:3150 length:1701 start_codon:yes stop_codon:yes gene_type:complete